MRRALALLVVAASCECGLPAARDLVFACRVDDDCGPGTACVDGLCAVRGDDGRPTARDAGFADAGAPPRDGGLPPKDAGTLADAGVVEDAGTVVDAATLLDAGEVDAGVVDAGDVDAGPFDAGFIPPDWWDTAFTKRKRLDVDTTKVTGGPHGSFVALVKLVDDEELAAFAADDGHDVAFATLDGATQLAHELVSFDGATGALVAWVRISTVASTGTSIRLYFGAAAVDAQAAAAATWGGEHAGVWHLDDYAASIVDSSQNGNHGTPIGMDATNEIDGIVGGALFWEGQTAAQSIDCGDDASLDLASPLTTSAWVRLADASYDQYVRVLNKKNGWDACCGYDMEAHPLQNRVDTITAFNDFTGATGVDWAAGDWHHYVVVHDGALVRIYVDGVEVAERTNAAPIRVGGIALQIGSIGTRAYDFFYGTIDEVRVVAAARGPGRVATEHVNQRDPSSFFVVGALESL